jgi:hypothetical protein
MTRPVEVVWLHEYRTYAFLISMGAYYSHVKFSRNGLDYEIIVENDDFETWEEHAVDRTDGS